MAELRDPPQQSTVPWVGRQSERERIYEHVGLIHFAALTQHCKATIHPVKNNFLKKEHQILGKSICWSPGYIRQFTLLRPQSALHTALQRECCLPENPLLHLPFSWLIHAANVLQHPAYVRHRDPVVNQDHQASNTDRHELNALMKVPVLRWHAFLSWGEWSQWGPEPATLQCGVAVCPN